MASQHQIVIIGASFGGISIAHGLLKDVLPALSAGGKKSFKVTMIAPSPTFYFKIGAPRVIANPAALPVKKAMLPIADGFKNYSSEQFLFIEAFAESIDPVAKSVKTSSRGTIHYDSLVIASGTSFASPLWSNSQGADVLSAAIKDMHERLPRAQTILIAGGGAVGTETAGELGQTYGTKKEVTLLSGSSQLLPRLANKTVGKDAAAKLAKYGVKVINNLRVTKATKEGDKDVLQLSDGTTRTVDVFIDATGDRPNGKFVPQAWLNDKGYVKTDPQTLRLDVPGVTNVYAIGTVTSYSTGTVMDVKFASKPLLETIKLDLSGKEPGPRTKNVYKKMTSDLQVVPIGSTGGVGVLFGYKLPSFMVKMIKSKDFMIGGAPKLVDGTE